MKTIALWLVAVLLTPYLLALIDWLHSLDGTFGGEVAYTLALGLLISFVYGGLRYYVRQLKGTW